MGIDREKSAQRKMHTYLKTLNSTDFFFLHGIARNVDSSTLKQVLQALAQAQEEGAGEIEKGVEGTTSTISHYDLLAGKDDMQDLIDKEMAANTTDGQIIS